jgi:hypothetical protein
MNMQRAGICICTLLLAAALSGCCCGGGGETTTVQPTTVNTVPVGQQLIDLQKAYESGAITEEEYKKLKSDMMEKSGEK